MGSFREDLGREVVARVPDIIVALLVFGLLALSLAAGRYDAPACRPATTNDGATP